MFSINLSTRRRWDGLSPFAATPSSSASLTLILNVSSFSRHNSSISLKSDPVELTVPEMLSFLQLLNLRPFSMTPLKADSVMSISVRFLNDKGYVGSLS